MRSKLLITTAALLASVAFASAQSMPGGGREAPAQSQGAQGSGAQGSGGAGDRHAPQSGPMQRGQDRQGEAQGGQRAQKDQKDLTTGQAPRGQKEDMKEGQKDPLKDRKAQDTQRGGDSQKGKGQAQQRGPHDRDQTTGQNPREQGQREQNPAQQGQSTQRQEGRSGGNVTLTTEQRTKVRETVLVGNAPRVNNVNFALTVGTAVPTSVRVVEVPPTLIEIHPEWRGHMYFVVGDEIVIVDRNHHIIAVIAV
jgi:hypothetical protein